MHSSSSTEPDLNKPPEWWVRRNTRIRIGWMRAAVWLGTFGSIFAAIILALRLEELWYLVLGPAAVWIGFCGYLDARLSCQQRFITPDHPQAGIIGRTVSFWLLQAVLGTGLWALGIYVWIYIQYTR